MSMLADCGPVLFVLFFYLQVSVDNAYWLGDLE